MTIDEEFVRKIVGSPGDDTPRLVYADWLEEMNDLRSSFLRKELELTQTIRNDEDAGSCRQLFVSLAEEFDPVWVARVSRPPFGVCCDDRKFSGDSSGISREVVEGISRQFGVSFAATHIAFLMNYNGGIPEPNHFVINQRNFTLNWFYDIRYPEGVPPEKVFTTHDQMQGPLESFIARWKITQKPLPLPQPRRNLPERQSRDWFQGPPTLPVPAVEYSPIHSTPLAFGWGKGGGSLSIEPSGTCTIFHANNEELDFMRTVDRDPFALPKLLFISPTHANSSR